VEGTGNENKNNAFIKLVEQVEAAYARANIPTISRAGIKKKVYYYHDKVYKGFVKMNATRKNLASSKSKFSQFQKQLDTTMPLWPTGVECKLNYEDRAFLESMKTDRVANMG